MWLWIYRLLICIYIMMRFHSAVYSCVFDRGLDFDNYFGQTSRTIYLSRITSHLKHWLFSTVKFHLVYDNCLQHMWYESFAPLWYSDLLYHQQLLHIGHEMRIRGVLFLLLCFFITSNWQYSQLMGIPYCNHWTKR